MIALVVIELFSVKRISIELSGKNMGLKEKLSPRMQKQSGRAPK